VVAVAGNGTVGGNAALGLVRSLAELDIKTVYLGRQTSAADIAAAAVRERADTVELCLAGAGGVSLMRELLRALIDIGRRDVSIVVHRVDARVARAPR